MKKILLYILILCLLSAVVALVFLARKKEEQKVLVSERVQQLPDFSLPDLEGVPHLISSLSGGGPVLLIYFNSACEICQVELKSIGDRAEEFKDARILLITSQEKKEVASFMEQHPLSQYGFVNILLDEEMKVAEHYGVKSVPEIYCYTNSGALAGSFSGPVKVDVLLEKLGIEASLVEEKEEVNFNPDR